MTDVVICPGSRSTPLALGAYRHPNLRTHMVLDERAAGFVALGIGLATQRPCAVVTTSGTAAVELHPSVVEASYSSVPMIALTADRPPELQGKGAPQTINQRHLFGTSVRWFIEPGPPDEYEATVGLVVGRDLFEHATGLNPGPVHANLAFREPLTDGLSTETITALAVTPRVTEVEPTDEQIARVIQLVSGRRGVLIAGARTTHSDAERQAIDALADALGWPVVADALSGLRGPGRSIISHSDVVLRGEVPELAPEVCLRLGALLSSKRLYEWLRVTQAQQIGCDRYGVIADPQDVLCEHVVAAPASLARRLVGSVRPTDPEWISLWRQHDDAAHQRVLAARWEFTGPAATVLEQSGDGSAIMLGSSMTVREAEWYGPPSAARVFSNRGANGIDGTLATAVGLATHFSQVACVLGDLAALYDITSLVVARQLGVNLCVIVSDNGGGAIFSHLPNANVIDAETFHHLFTARQDVSLSRIAQACGAETSIMRTADELAAAFQQWRTDTRGVRVLVVPRELVSELEDSTAR